MRRGLQVFSLGSTGPTSHQLHKQGRRLILCLEGPPQLRRAREPLQGHSEPLLQLPKSSSRRFFHVQQERDWKNEAEKNLLSRRPSFKFQFTVTDGVTVTITATATVTATVTRTKAEEKSKWMRFFAARHSLELGGITTSPANQTARRSPSRRQNRTLGIQKPFPHNQTKLFLSFDAKTRHKVLS